MARRRGRGKYRYTPKRRAALKRAQILSARKRKGKKIAIGVGIASAGVLSFAAARHISGSRARKNLVSSQAAAAASTTGSPTGGRDIVKNPPRTVARPNKGRKGWAQPEFYAMSEQSIRFRKTVGNPGTEGAPSRAVRYVPTEEWIRSSHRTSSTNPLIRMLMKEAEQEQLVKWGYT